MKTIENLVCSLCRQEKPVSEFAKQNNRKRGYQHYCRSCQKHNDSLRYQEDKVRIDARNKAAKERIAETIRAAKSIPCADCKEAYPYYVMDFDHVRGVKAFTLSTMAKYAPPMRVVLEEIAKCDVVCANCHRERTYRRPTQPDG